MNPPDNAAVLCLDEKTQIQALERTQPRLPLRENLPARQTHDYRRNGLTSLYLAMEVARGRVIGECSAQHTSADFLRFLKKIARSYAGELHVILDNSSTHKTPVIQEWLEAHPRIHFHFTPTGALLAQPRRSLVQHPDQKIHSSRFLPQCPHLGSPHRGLNPELESGSHALRVDQDR